VTAEFRNRKIKTVEESILHSPNYCKAMQLTAVLRPKWIRVMTPSITLCDTRSHRTIEKTLLRAMKISAVLLFAGLSTMAARTEGQTVTLDLKDAPIQKVLKEASKQTGISIIYNESLFKDFSPVTIKVKDVTIQQVLEECLKNQPFTYSFEGNLIVINKKQPTASAIELQIEPPPMDIHGHVTDSLGHPLAGASITVKGMRTGTSTDANGDFILSGVKDNAALIISYTGYTNREYRIKGQTFFTIVLDRKNSPLDQVQVIAYGTTTQRLATGDVNVVTAKTIEQQPVSNPLAALEGEVPGLFITQATGVPGGSFNIQIRGQNSIANGNDPFYVIDGVPYSSTLLNNLGFSALGSGSNGTSGNPLSYINPSDIESISILKDADATAIYGSRAANGAILITTKKGKAGGTRLDVNVYSGIGKVPLNVNWLNTPQYLQIRNEAFKNDGIVPDNNSAPDLLVWDTTRYTNWQKTLIGGTAHYNDAQISLSGGSANTQYLFGGGYHSESTVFPTDAADKKASLHINITNTSMDQKFKLFFSGNYVVDNSSLPSGDMSYYLQTPPDAPNPFNPDGSLNFSNSTYSNPYAQLKQIYKSQTNNLVSNAILSYNVFNGLQVLSSFGYTNMQINENSITPISSQNPAYNPLGYSDFTNNNIHSWIVEPQINYKTNIGTGKMEALLGSTFEQKTANGQILYGSGYTSDALLQDPQAAPSVFIQSSNSVYKYNALFARVNYNYQDKYIVNLNWRRDGSSRFGPDNQFHNFGSIGLAWIFTNENLLKNNLPWLSFGKVRTSYGSTGNDQIGDYHFYDLFSPTQFPYQNTVGLTPTGFYNPELQWELTKKFEAGLDLGFVKDRILINASYYLNRSSNQLLVTALPQFTGFASIPVNLPATVQNDGLEFTLNTTNIKSTDFSWTSSINLSIPRNELISFPNLANSAYQNSYIIGQPITIRRQFHMVGVNDTTGIYEFKSSQGINTYTPTPITDWSDIINTAPLYYGGFKNTFNYKGFQLDFLFQFTKQMGSNILFQYPRPPGFFAYNEPQTVLNRWQKPGDQAPTEQFTQSFSSSAFTGYEYAQSGNQAYVDASYIRLKNLSLSYRLPASWIHKIHLQNCSVYIHGQNLLTITNYKGTDPESQSVYSLPPLRVITGGIQLSL
jgi:TonB-linked SusC/RagA family outer membrane protein